MKFFEYIYIGLVGSVNTECTIHHTFHLVELNARIRIAPNLQNALSVFQNLSPDWDNIEGSLVWVDLFEKKHNDLCSFYEFSA